MLVWLMATRHHFAARQQNFPVISDGIGTLIVMNVKLAFLLLRQSMAAW